MLQWLKYVLDRVVSLSAFMLDATIIIISVIIVAVGIVLLKITLVLAISQDVMSLANALSLDQRFPDFFSHRLSIKCT